MELVKLANIMPPPNWRPIPVRPVHRFVVGLDVGQSIDPSAVSVVEHVVKPLETWEVNDKAKIYRQQREERFLVRHLERLPLGMSYPLQIQHVANLLNRPPLDRGCDFALDYTGCGRPVADMFDRAGLRPMKVLITAGNEVARGDGFNVWNVPKSYLISTLESRLHSGELKIAPALTEAGVLKDEMRDFARKVSESGRVTWSARAGKHDDIILSICVALFAALNRTFVSRSELRL